LVELFQGTLPRELIIFIISMLPILELRGGMIAAKLLGVSLGRAFVICYLGNIVPIPFILLFIRKIFRLLSKTKPGEKIVKKLESTSKKKEEQVLRYKHIGLLTLVAIPLPGTGGWTGALVAALMDLRMRTSLPIIALGVLIADTLMALISYGLLGIFIK
jgi:uncharacterized membrane protein